MEGIELKVARIRAGISQWRLAQEAGLHPCRLSEMETGRRPVSKAVVDALEKLLVAAKR